MTTTFHSEILAGKTAFISGGSSGIGLGIARELARHGARITVIGRNEEKAAAAAASIIAANGAAALGIATDVRNYTAVDAAIEQTVARFGPLDIIVAAAAGNFVAPAQTLSANAFKTVVEIDLIGCFNVFRAAHSHLRLPGASLIAISSGHSTRAVAGQVHANAAKAGINMLVKGLALEWGPQGIRTNALIPGPVTGTEGMARLLPQEQVAAYIAGLPLRRLAEVQEIAAAALFLASPAASYVNGAILECDGGSGL